MSHSSILIVGGAGYIGSHVVKVLRSQGLTPIVIDDLSTGHSESIKTTIKNKEFYESSYANSELLKDIIKRHHIQSAMHFGAKALVAESVKSPSLYYRSNVAESLILLDALVESGVKNFIFSSSCAVFGKHDGNAITETAPKDPINPYGHTKLILEQILKDYDTAYGLKSGILRYFNAGGADPEGELGEDHNPETHLIPNVLKVALGINPKLVINGSDYATSDGSCVRDYVHVNDLATAHIKTLDYLLKTNESCDFNLGSGQGHSILEVVKAASKICGKEISYELGPRRPGDPAKLIADPSKIKKQLGWKTEFSIEDIIETNHQWMKAHPTGYNSSRI